MMLVSSINYNRSLPHLIGHFQIANKLVLGWDCVFSSVPVSVTTPWFLRFHGTGSGTLVLVLTRYQTFHWVNCIFLILVLVWSHLDTILVPNQMEPEALVLEPKWTGA